MSDVFVELKSTGRLPSPSPVGMKILQLTQQEDYCTDEVSEAIQVDPALTGQILKIANSAENASVETATTVSEATMRLGVTAVRNVALGFTLVSGNRAGDCEGFDYDAHWAESIVRAVAAQRLAANVEVNPEEAFICALLAGVGRLAFASVHSLRYSELLAKAGTADELAQAERDAFHISAAEVTAEMLTEWGLPRTFSDAILEVEEFDDEAAERDHASLLTVLWCASRVAEACVADPESCVRWGHHLDQIDRVCSLLGLDRAEFEVVHADVQRQWSAWNKSLGLPMPTAVPLERMAELAQSTGASGAEPPKASKTMNTNPKVGDRDRLRILAVDSDPAVLELIRSELEPLDHRLVVAESGNEGMKAALDCSPHLILASDELAGMSGFELCKAMRRFEGGRKAFFILMSNTLDEEKLATELESGVDEHLVKPLNPRLLVARIKSAQRVINLQENLESEKEKVAQQLAELGVLTRRLRAASLTDPLTELPNRRFAMKRLEQEWTNAQRNGTPLSVVTIDIDHFKSVNDDFGHDVGDAVLREVANVLRNATRKGEQPARIGGEEFLVVLRECGRDGAMRAAERIRVMAENHVVRGHGFDRSVTLSLGAATFSGQMSDVNELLKASDEALYEAKRSGRNRTCYSGDESTERKAAG